jgi:cellulose synthase/poly-beta-1,6-N-acetylglucosamine synthase-like glycosyltransferase
MCGYLGVLTLAGGHKRRRPDPRDRAGPGRRADDVSAGHRRFAILVPAHDEEPVIGRALESFSALEYPADRHDVYVVADNCADGTAAVARRYGVEVHERTAPDDAGKGPALNWMINILEERSDPPDVYVIVDADTQVEPAFLAEFDAALTSPAVEVVQGCYLVSEPEESSTAALRYAALACRHHLRPLGRTRIGASCGLYGNGMAISGSVMRSRRWSGHLVEDAEFQMELLLDGVLVAYAPRARLHAEMPASRARSVTQNQRWELGRIQLARRYGPTLVSQAIRSRHRRIAHADAVFDHLVPPLSVLSVAQLASAVMSATMFAGRGRPVDRVRLVVAGLASATLAAHVVVGLSSVDAPRSVYRALLGAPRAIAWKAALWVRVIVAPEQVSWTRTERNKSTLGEASR